MNEDTESKLSLELTNYTDILKEIYPSYKMIPDHYDLDSIYLDRDNFGSQYEDDDSEVRVDVRLYARKNSTNQNYKYADGFTLGFFRNPLTKTAKAKFGNLPYTYHDFIINKGGASVHLSFLDPTDSIIGERIENIGRVGVYGDTQIEDSKEFWLDFYTKNASQISRLFSGINFQNAYLDRFNEDEFKMHQAFKTPYESRKEDEKRADETKGYIIQISILLFIGVIVIPTLLRACKG